MPSKPRRPCAEIGCGKLTDKTYCEDHQKLGEEIRRKSTQIYNRYGRDSEINSFYKSKEWKHMRALAFERDNGLCQRCVKRGILKSANVVHHIIEVKEDWNQRLLLSNLESLCHSCHNAHHKTAPRG